MRLFSRTPALCAGHLLLCLVLLLAHASAQGQQVPSGLVQLGDGSYFSPYALVVDKTARTLSLWKSEGGKIEKIKEYPSDIGKKLGNKMKKDDHRTPEGVYFFESQLDSPAIPFDKYGKRAFTMNYPNLFDKRAGKTGYGIWLHSIPDTETLERGSRGCVVVRNDAIMELSDYISLHKTPILVFNNVTYSDLKEVQNRFKGFESFLSRWTQAWSNEDIEAYMSFYSDNFYSLRMNKERWKTYKQSLNEKYNNIQVVLYSPVIFEHQDGIIIRSLQAYSSTEHQDFGEKTIYIKMENNEPKIIAEEWAPVEENPQLVQKLAKCCSEPSSKN